MVGQETERRPGHLAEGGGIGLVGRPGRRDCAVHEDVVDLVEADVLVEQRSRYGRILVRIGFGAGSDKPVLQVVRLAVGHVGRQLLNGFNTHTHRKTNKQTKTVSFVNNIHG